MLIYTGNAFGRKFQKVKDNEMGIMISSSPITKPSKEFRDVPCALDNGAFPAHKKGYPFMEKVFLNTMDECYRLGIKLDFIVCPDIVGGGEKSLDFSCEWAMGRLKTAPNLAIVVQDGMIAPMIDEHVLSLFTHLFVGGSPDWKWRTIPGWASLCHSYKIPCHVGQCGTLQKLQLCKKLGVTSVDSTNFARNESWSVISQFRQDGLFGDRSAEV